MAGNQPEVFGLDAKSIPSMEADVFVGCNCDLFIQESQNIKNTTAPWIKMDGLGNEMDEVIAASKMMAMKKTTDQMTRAAVNTPTNGIEMKAGVETTGWNDSDIVVGNGNEMMWEMIPGGMIGKTVHPSDIVVRNDIPAQNEVVVQSKTVTVKPSVTLVRSKTFVPSEILTGDQIGTVIQPPNLKSVSKKGSVQEVKRSLSVREHQPYDSVIF
jgi:hypothetical protein